MLVLIAPDKFKGTLPAREVAASLARGWQRARPGDTVDLLPITDGGDGFGAVMGALFGAEDEPVSTVNAAHQPMVAAWGWAPACRRAVIESARAVGLAQLPAGRFHPFELDTFGLGALLRRAEARGATDCLVGIGGSATNDGGFGLARALGWKFFDRHSSEIERWTSLHSLAVVRPPAGGLPKLPVTVAVDVRNPLLGPTGCTRIYGPQKGLRPEDFDLAEQCLTRLAAVVEAQSGRTFRDEPGAGAAGGLGFGLRTFAGARLVEGFRLFAELAQLHERTRKADLVLTGEGAMDVSTLMGKGVGELARLCAQQGVPCIGFAGRVGDGADLGTWFRQVHPLTPDFVPLETALAQTAIWLERLAERVAQTWPS